MVKKYALAWWPVFVFQGFVLQHGAMSVMQPDISEYFLSGALYGYFQMTFKNGSFGKLITFSPKVIKYKNDYKNSAS